MAITRRDFVTGLTVAAIRTKLRGDVLSAAANSVSLDIGFHGLWVFFVGNRSILAATPWNSEHCYLAREVSGAPMVIPKGGLRFTRLTGGTGTFPISNKLNWPYKQGIAAQSWWATVLLPVPASVQVRRPSQIKFLEDTQARTGYLSYHLRYDADPTNPPVIAELPQWKPNWQSGSANMNFHAEPDHVSTFVHASAALDDLCAKLGLNCHTDPNVSYPPPPLPTADEDKSLYELQLKCPGSMAPGMRAISQRGVFRLVDGAVVDCNPLVIAEAPVPAFPG
jgi:hypothetical protein